MADEQKPTEYGSLEWMKRESFSRVFSWTEIERALNSALADQDTALHAAQEEVAKLKKDTFPWGEEMRQYAALGIGVEAWVDLEQAERYGHEHRYNDRSGVSVKWSTFRLVMTVLRMFRLRDDKAKELSAAQEEIARLKAGRQQADSLVDGNDR